MLKRRFYDEMLSWKQGTDHKPLVIKGCRQCGKTYLVKYFAKENYENVVYLNFLNNNEFIGAFAGPLQVDDIIMYLSAILGKDAKFVPGKTVIIFDEIQECPEARTALKFFAIDGRYDVICTGSLLGVKGYSDRAKSIPVGYETIRQMYPLDFEEFLWANGISDQVIELLKQSVTNKTVVPDVIHNKMRELLLQYVVVGGMPAVVQHFIDTKLLNEVLQMQRDIVDEYKDDMLKYATDKDKPIIRECFNSIPRQLAKENKKFQYSVVGKGLSSNKCSGSIEWIEDAGIVNRCYNLHTTELPLDGNAIFDNFKLYMADTGLLISMLEDGTQSDIIHGNMLGYKGAIFENLIADIFAKRGKKLYFYHKDSGLELDFVTRMNGECIPVEVKATNGNAKSLKTVMNHPEKYHITSAIKLGDYNVGYKNNILTLPLYMAQFIC